MVQQYNQNSWKQFETMDRANTVLLLPISSMEQHGTHLPVGTDDFILQLVLNQVVGHCDVTDDFLLLPTIHYGMSPEHMSFLGTITLSPATVIAMVEDVLKSVKAHGFQKVVLINSHGGNTSFLHALSQTWKYNFGMEIYHVDFWGNDMFQKAADLLETPVPLDVHGGEIETSILMYSNQLAVPASEIPGITDYLTPLPYNRGSWTAGELSKSGAIGGVSKSTPETGKALLDFMVNQVVTQLNDLKHQ